MVNIHDVCNFVSDIQQLSIGHSLGGAHTSTCLAQSLTSKAYLY